MCFSLEPSRFYATYAYYVSPGVLCTHVLNPKAHPAFLPPASGTEIVLMKHGISTMNVKMRLFFNGPDFPVDPAAAVAAASSTHVGIFSLSLTKCLFLKMSK